MLSILILLVTTNLLLLPSQTSAGIGEVTELKGSGSIKRDSSRFIVQQDASVEMDDYIQTAKGVVGITFDDDTEVRVSEHSELIIDDFVYDPSTRSGTLGLKVSLGTVKYASGFIAQNPANVAINTPSATIAVRGTSFAMTVNELGGSTIILLPNVDGTVGEIEVMSDMGAVIMSTAFQATAVRARGFAPTKPVILSIDINAINNLMIISPPPKIKEKLLEANRNALSVDWLAFTELELDLLETDKALDWSDLNIDPLGFDLLAEVLYDPLLGERDGRIHGFNAISQIYTIIEDPSARIIRIAGNQVLDLVFDIENGIYLELIQGADQIQFDTKDWGSNNIIRIYQE